ncbi:Rieske 2Fe-2S domain-containing protein [Conexibacter sp. CPCC 206217]|uniref:Rieske (2Fe-2S) protein n=1 Tax=Conexibacter sp. CPCC 206217 TaxID=3064574 RepID=UPI002716B9A5|nr:Rieske 2Fe-2S domain-containing protein [Conexibacter sp. CPCC 206217]MDO8208896.1 Rieske 2Fe-2S domain-containing protein [Conexibacter sp. CPCC 206217]
MSALHAPRKGPRQPRRHRLGAVADFPLGEFRLHEVEGREVAVIRTARGFFAIRNGCPHMGAPLCFGKVGGTMLPSDPDELVYGLEDEVVRCPWHAWEFHLATGRAVGGITSKRVIAYPVETGEDGVFLVVGGTRVREA